MVILTMPLGAQPIGFREFSLQQIVVCVKVDLRLELLMSEFDHADAAQCILRQLLFHV